MNLHWLVKLIVVATVGMFAVPILLSVAVSVILPARTRYYDHAEGGA